MSFFWGQGLPLLPSPFQSLVTVLQDAGGEFSEGRFYSSNDERRALGLPGSCRNPGAKSKQETLIASRGDCGAGSGVGLLTQIRAITHKPGESSIFREC